MLSVGSDLPNRVAKEQIVSTDNLKVQAVHVDQLKASFSTKTS